MTLIFATNVIIKNLNKYITALSIINKYYTEKLVSSLLILLYLYKLDNIMLLFISSTSRQNLHFLLSNTTRITFLSRKNNILILKKYISLHMYIVYK